MTDTTVSERILVGVDGSETSIDALRYAARLAEALDVPLEAVTTWVFPAVAEDAPVDTWSPEDDAQEILDASIAQAFGGTPPARLARTVLPGPAARTLIQESERCGMLVLGSRGHGGFARMLLGSVSAACAEHARCPVLVMHSPRETPAGSTGS